MDTTAVYETPKNSHIALMKGTNIITEHTAMFVCILNSLKHAIATADLQAGSDEAHHTLVLWLIITRIICNYKYIAMNTHPYTH